MTADISGKLFSMRDEQYQIFQSKLIPTLDSSCVIGVRTPALRAFARTFTHEPQCVDFLQSLPHIYYEENNLHAFLIEQINDLERVLDAVNEFLPHVDNWATCDALRPKVFNRCRGKLLEHIRIWLKSDHVYTVRFALEMLMIHFLDEEFRPEYLEMAAAVKGEDYYVRMMVAWYFATALAKQYQSAIEYLRQRRLDHWTHQKTIQKAIESYRITPDQKAYLRTLRY